MKNSVTDGFDVDALIKKLEEAERSGKTNIRNILIPMMVDSPTLVKAMQSGPQSLRRSAEMDLESRIDKLL